MQTAPIDKTGLRSLRTALLVIAASAVLAACGGGAQTTELPLPNGGGNTNDNPYTGPVARDAEVLRFQQEFWGNAKTTDRCGSCHNETIGQLPMFVRNDDVNMAYDAAVTVTDTDQPSLSRTVERVGSGHHCWVTDPGVCATIMTTWIENWLGDTSGGGREIVLTPPPSQEPGASKNFPLDPGAFAATVYPVLDQYCSNCHSSESANAQQPYFADPDITTAYDAAKPKINLDVPANSRLVIRLRNEFHNCWDNCSANAQTMEDAITTFSNGIVPTVVDENLVTSKALRLVDGTLASGGNRYEDAQIALWEFKTGTGLTAFDTSGVDPAVDLNLSPEVTWYGGWGITTNGGIARGTTTASKKLYDVIQVSGEFSIEAWVIPANVTQEMARIVSYSAGDQARNFTLQQTLYNYDFLLRTNETNLNGDPALSTPDGADVLQATLQHVVVTYNPIAGRMIYVNGELVSAVDPVPGGTLIDWQETFAFVIGNEVSGDGPWEGTVRLAAVHRRALTQEQIVQNFDVGVGEKFFMLFDISENLYPGDATMAQSSYILFEVAQYDSYAYLFDRPHFVTLDGSTPEGIPIEGVRVAMNGLEAPVGQTYATLNDMLSASEFGELGQPLSVLGAVLPLEKGPEDDEFFLTFDRLAGDSFDRPDYPTLVVTPADLDPASKIGIRTFDEINASFSSVLGIDWTDPNYTNVDLTYQELRQSLPAVEDINTFLSSHQVAVAQLAIAYCDALIGTNASPNPAATAFFPGFNFGAPNSTAFAVGNRDAFVNPLIDKIMGTGLASQPNRPDVYAELAAYQSVDPLGRPDNLIDRLLNPPPILGVPSIPSDTRDIAKGVCAAMIGNAVTLIQ
jgi:hypothetical protein